MAEKWTGERIMKAILDVLIQGEQFEDNARPSWLRSPNKDTKAKMELDRYYPRLKLAFEFQGEQHSTYVPGMQMGPNEFYFQVWKDKRKVIVCRDKGIRLIHIDRGSLGVRGMQEHLQRVLWPEVLQAMQPLWEQRADKLDRLEGIAMKYRNAKVKKKKIKEAIPPEALTLYAKPGEWWQDKEGGLHHNSERMGFKEGRTTWAKPQPRKESTKFPLFCRHCKKSVDSVENEHGHRTCPKCKRILLTKHGKAV